MAFLPEGQADRSQARSAWEPCREPRPGHMCYSEVFDLKPTSGLYSARWSIGVLEYWSIGVLEYWSIGVLEYWSVGVLGCWGRMSALRMNFERVGSVG
jgi:hypothetical protein